MTEMNWGVIEIPDELEGFLQIHTLRIWYKKKEDELWLAYDHAGSDTTGSQPDPPDNSEWQRWTMPQRFNQIKIQPAFPNLPVLIKPATPFRLATNTKTRIFVRIPVWIKILVGKDTLIELPTRILSKSWFGNFLDGEICYWAVTEARKHIPLESVLPYYVICPIEILNESGGDLLVDKICHRVNRLSIYIDDEQLWANEIHVAYHGRDAASDIEFNRSAPQEAKNAKRVAGPRDAVRRSFAIKTFDSLKDLTSFFH